MARIDETRPFLPVNIAVLTVSDTRIEADDKSGNTLIEHLTTDGHRFPAQVRVVPLFDRGIERVHVDMQDAAHGVCDC